MFDLLLNSVTPVASIIFLGYITAKLTFFNYENGITLTKFVGRIGVPCLIINLITNFDFNNLSWLLVYGYLVSEVIIFVIGISIAYFIFRKNISESIIIGMASAFANHLFFVYPIAKFEYEENLILPIVGIIGIDILFLVFTIFILDVVTSKKINLKIILFKQFKNPPLIGIIIGLFFINTNLEVPLYFQRTISMISESAIPCGLFATGIFLSTNIDKNMIKISFLISILKVLIHPLIAVVIIKYVLDFNFECKHNDGY